MMITVLIFGEEIAVLAIALVTVGIASHKSRRGGRGARISAPAIVASLLAIAGVVIFYVGQLSNAPVQPVAWHYAVVLVAAAIALTLIAVTTRSTRRPLATGARLNFDAVDLTAGRAWSYGKTWWMVAWVVLALMLVATVVLAGMAASPDDAGRSAVITIVAGTTTASTDFPGWFYGVPVLIALAMVIASTLIAMSRVTGLLARASRSPYVFAARQMMVRRIMGLSTGAIAFTLGSLWLFLARSSALATQLPITGGNVDVVTSFAALQIPLNGLGLILCGMGVGIIAASGISKMPQDYNEDTPLQEWQRTNGL